MSRGPLGAILDRDSDAGGKGDRLWHVEEVNVQEPSSSELRGEQLQRLQEVGRSLVSELELDTVLRHLLDAARDLTGAAYAAVGVLDEDGQALERFVYVGIDDETRHAIGPLPRGRGVLGELIRRPEPLRLPDVGAHEHSYGFPANHPPMRTFLGTPVLIRGRAWGNLYLTEKSGGREFTESDESLVVVLAAWAAVAIENARLYEGLDSRRVELERATLVLEVNADISRAAASGIGMDPLLELIAKRARSLADAELSVVLVQGDAGLVVATAAGEGAEELVGRRTAGPDSASDDLGLRDRWLDSITAPLPFRGSRSGMLIACRTHPFSEEDRRLFESLATSAATTIASVRNAEAEKIRLSIRASEEEKKRWARELHDQTLQELGALRFLLETAAGGTANQLRSATERALQGIDQGIEDLHGLITELRPASLDQLGVGPAVEALADRTQAMSGIAVRVAVDLADGDGGAHGRLEPELESSVYRLVQEGLNNAVKHAEPTVVSIEVQGDGEMVTVRVEDDGKGFDPEAERDGFGLVGMRERIDLIGGRLEIDSALGRGTVVTAELPTSGPAPAGHVDAP